MAPSILKLNLTPPQLTPTCFTNTLQFVNTITRHVVRVERMTAAHHISRSPPSLVSCVYLCSVSVYFVCYTANHKQDAISCAGLNGLCNVNDKKCLQRKGRWSPAKRGCHGKRWRKHQDTIHTPSTHTDTFVGYFKLYRAVIWAAHLWPL